MSKIDEAKLLDGLIAIAEYLKNMSALSLSSHQLSAHAHEQMVELINHFQVVETGTVVPEALGTPVNYWFLTEGANGPFELLKMMDTEEYRMLKAEVQDKDHPIFHDFGGDNYKIWLMRDNETMSQERYKRFCSVCRRATYEFYCCGQRTRRINLQRTVRDEVPKQVDGSEKT